MRFTLFATALMVLPCFAQAEKFSIRSKLDSFELETNSSGGGSIAGKEVPAERLKDVLPLLTSPVSNDCPASTKGAPDATVKIGEKTRMIYLSAGQVKEGDQCLQVDGDGLMFFPLHRDFLIGSDKGSIPVKGMLEVEKGGKVVFNIKKEGDDWSNENKDQLLNWEFAERFENSLKDFRIRFRVLPSAAKGKPEVKVITDGKTYRFFKITNQTWAMEKPKARWLEASDDWAFWYDLDGSELTDRNADAIKIVADTTGQTLPARQDAMSKLGSTWSPNLRELYLKIIVDPKDVNEIQQQAMKRLRAKPSEATAKGLARVLAQIPDDGEKRAATQVLKMYYPKGPLYNPSATEAQRREVVEFWSHRWNKKP